jgi:peptide/nickel transport system permease protein
MGSYIVRRIALLFLVLLGIITITFFVTNFIPADPAKAAAGQNAGPAQVAAVRHELGLDRPVPVQYAIYIAHLFQGNLGVSILTRRPVLDELGDYLPSTVELVVAAMILNVLIGVPMGVLSAVRSGGVVDNVSRLLTSVGVGLPTFWVGLMLQLVFYGNLNVLPSSGQLGIFTTPPPHVTGMVLVDSFIARQPDALWDALRHLIAPAATLALGLIAVTTRLTRTSMLETLAQDYVRTARSKGLKPRAIIFGHALRNAFLPTLTMLGLQSGFLIGGTVLVESVFSWGGLGTLLFNSLKQADYPVIMGVTLVGAVTFVLANLVVDVLYVYFDPRIRYT